MSSSLTLESLSSDNFNFVHQACEEFEQALRGNEPISIEQQLEKAPPEVRTILLNELLAIELEWRRARQEAPEFDDYSPRFPGNLQIIERLFQEIASQNSLRFESATQVSNFSSEHRIPQKIGRYLVSQLIGAGAFGLVYRATDPTLDRTVAIKVPRPEIVADSKNVEAYLAEGRALASLSHPNIVPVHDVGSNKDFPCFIVLEHIEGESLATKLKRGRFSTVHAAELIATIAEALHYAHNHGLTHRDVKPSNIHIASDGRPYLIDFGLAILDEDIGSGPRYAGTVAYMSPEQARGEGHRVDGRSDIFSLGAVLYEVLSGHRAFRGNSTDELMHQVATLEPRPLRQYDEKIPQALVQVCSKAIAKRALDRYASAFDMAQDLRHFLTQGTPAEDRSSVAGSSVNKADVGSQSSDCQLIRIVPKGLRSFDDQDAGFFMNLLPGVRDAVGLPESLRFWKSKIEQTDAELTFSVGLLYGPSGCGKSSLVKAGLLPSLTRDVVPIYVEATATDTIRLTLQRLQRRFPSLPTELKLQQTLRELRTGRYLGPSEKILLVFDQFEQWLHANLGKENTDLVQALRQCDGSKLQCLVMVRDDFWMAATRFMHELENYLLDGVNSRSIDLFTTRHAKKVLTAFGQAFGAISENSDKISVEQNSFLDKAVELLVVDGTVMCVRLALFAQLMSNKPWTPETLQLTGGVTSIGTEFLEATFNSPKSPPAHRYHQKAARAVLQMLLPDLSSDIKGNMQPYDSLLAASGYPTREEFDKLLKILDHELRLITPTESIETRPDEPSESVGTQTTKNLRFYQLTHDYLVSSLRSWLFQKQQETRRGRAELLLADRSALWNKKPDSDLLPRLWDFLTIRWWTNPKKWTRSEAAMMQRASNRLLFNAGCVFAIVALLLTTLRIALHFQTQHNLASRAKTIVAAVQLTRGEFVPSAIKEMQLLPERIVLPELRAHFSSADDDRHKLALAFALAHFGEVESDFMVSMISESTSVETANFYVALHRNQERSLQAIRNAIATIDSIRQPRRAAQLAIVALQFGEANYFRAFCENKAAPLLQTMIIEELPLWHGNLIDLSELASFKEQNCRSCIACGIGSLPVHTLSSDEKSLWLSVFKNWYLNEKDAATHSAASWALRQWNVELPELIETGDLANNDWQLNSIQMTMCRIPAGTFTRSDTLYDGESSQAATITRDFLIADLEVSVEQFHTFVSDPNYASSDKPNEWEGEDTDFSPTGKHPIQRVSWYDAVLFCNWLSRREGLEPCYSRTGREDETERRGLEEWELAVESNGYRLPTEAEWELACRAGTSTKYFFGDDEAMLDRYAVYSTSRPLVCGHKLPNRYGLFDCTGNVYEWCHDWSGPYLLNSVSDPQNGNKLGMRVMRGGTYFNPAENCLSTHRNRSGPWGRSQFCGFRVARSSQ